MDNKSAQLKDGTEWIDHEDCIVGDEQGLKNLISACNTALEKGEYYGSDLGDYVGIKKQDTQWFKNPIDSKQTHLANTGLAAFLIFIAILIIIGVFTVFKWLIY